MVDSAASFVSALNDNAGKFVSVRKFGSKNCETVDNIANLDQIAKVRYPLAEDQE